MTSTRLRSALLAAPRPASPDAALLAAFARRRDEAAFAELVRRHAGLVRGAARRVLGDPAGADDIAQAAFLLLARKAGGRGWGPSVGPWLYRVAVRLAVKARHRANRQPAPLPADVPARPLDPAAGLSWAEAQAALDDGLSRLPEHLRAPLVLCYLQELTRDEAAAALGCPVDVLRGRLDRGRARLREYLSDRGLSLAAVLAGVAAADAGGRVAFVAAAARLAAGVPASGAAAAGWAWATAAVVVVAGACAAGLSGGPAAAPPAEAPPPRAAETPAPKVDALGDPLPPGALARMGSARLHHGRNVRKVAVSGDGKLIASVDSDDAVKLWETETGKEVPIRVGAGTIIHVARAGAGLAAVVRDGKTHRLVTLPAGPAAEVKGYAPNHDGIKGWLAPDGRTFLWDDPVHDPATGKHEWRAMLSDIVTGAAAVLTVREKDFACEVRWAADGKRAAVMFADRSLEVWDLVSRTKRFTVPKVESKMFETFDLSPDGRTVAREDVEVKAVRLWDVGTGRELPRLPDQPRGTGGGIAFSPDGRTIGCGTRPGAMPVVRLWDYRAGKLLGDTPPHDGPAYHGPDTMTFSADGRRLVGGNFNGVAVWDAATRRPLYDAGGHTGSPWAVVWSPDGTRLATGVGYGDPVGRVWDARTGRKLHDLVGHRTGVGSVAWSPDGRLLFTASQDNTARLWDAATGAAVHTFEVAGGGYGAVFTPDGRRLAVSGKAALHVFDAAARRPGQVVPLARPAHAWAVGGDRVYVTTEDGPRVVDLATGRPDPVPVGLPVNAYPVGRDRRWGLAKDEVTCRRFPLAGGAGVVVADLLKGPDGKPSPESMGADQTPDGRMVAVGYRTGFTVVYEAATARERFRLTGHAGDVLQVAYSPDGTRLATSSGDTSIIVWDATGGHLPPDPKDGADAWAGLAADDAKVGFAAVRWLAARPAEAVALLGGRLAPVPSVDPKAVAALVGRLGGASFAEREAAEKELAGLGEVAGPALAEAARSSASAEVRTRAAGLQAKLAARPSGDRLRAIRAVEVLERVGSTGARDVLKGLAGGAAGATLTREAVAALGRLG